LELAREKLRQLEAPDTAPVPLSVPWDSSPAALYPQQNDLFAAAEPHPVVAELAEINPDELSPKEALALLYQLREKL
jgi:DNA mismatch repair protein MutS